MLHKAKQKKEGEMILKGKKLIPHEEYCIFFFFGKIFTWFTNVAEPGKIGFRLGCASGDGAPWQ
jgi:hypothetical protein